MSPGLHGDLYNLTFTASVPALGYETYTYLFPFFLWKFLTVGIYFVILDSNNPAEYVNGEIVLFDFNLENEYLQCSLYMFFIGEFLISCGNIFLWNLID